MQANKSFMMQKQAATQREKQIMGSAKASLRDAMGAVQAALSAAPDNVVALPRNAREAFLLIDPVLSGIHRQLADARVHAAQIIAAFGPGDAMAESLMFQMAALERAYCERLYALRKKREEGRRTAKAESPAGENLSKVRGQETYGVHRNHGSMWSLVALLLIMRASSPQRKKSGPVLNAA